MSMKEREIKIKDRLVIALVRENNKIQYDSGWRNNGITKSGLSEIAKLAIGTGAFFNQIAIGIGQTPYDPNQTTLENEIARKNSTNGLSSTSDEWRDNIAVFSATFSKDDGLSGYSMIAESGVFNENVMLARQVLDNPLLVNWDTDILTVEWYIEFRIW